VLEHARFFAALRMTKIMLLRALSFIRDFFMRHPERSLRSEGSRPPLSGGAMIFNLPVTIAGDRTCES
jgi:hypothetical protein